MVIWSTFILVVFVCVRQGLAQTTAHMNQMCGGSIPTDDRYRQIIFKYDSTNITHRNCKVRVNHGYLKWRDNTLTYSEQGFLIVFQEVNLFNLDCGKVNVSVTKGIYFSGSDYDYYDFLPDPAIPGIPRPLCTWNIWTDYPTEIIKTESQNLDIWFKAAPDTPDGAGFKLLIVDYYDGSRRCQDGEYRCSNTRCITKSAENTDCDGIDWCTDNSGCRVNWGLVGGLIGGIGSALLGLTIGLCLRCYIKGKTNQRFGSYSSDGRYRPWPGERRVPAITNYERQAQAIYDNYRTTHEREGTRNAFRRLSDITSNSVAPSRNQGPGQGLPRSVHEPSNVEPPSYNSIWKYDANRTTDSTRTATQDATRPAVHQPSAEHETEGDSNAGDSYQPPPPEYELVTQYRGLYQVTESQPTIV